MFQKKSGRICRTIPYIIAIKKGAGLRYGITTCIQTGEIVDAVGSKPCGKWPDIKVYKKYVVLLLKEGEMVETDRGHCHITCRNPEDFVCKSKKKE